MQLILASTSPYRAELLQKLRLPFTQMAPEFAEIAGEGETPQVLCRRLAQGKALSVARQEPGAPYLILGSDQVASLPDGKILGKPGDFDTAFAQLKACSGRWVTFETAICLLADHGPGRVASEAFSVHFRTLTDTGITRYLNLERPFDCAASIKVESLGITLIDDARGRDINTLLGLPLILLVDMLSALGIDILNHIK